MRALHRTGHFQPIVAAQRAATHQFAAHFDPTHIAGLRCAERGVITDVGQVDAVTDYCDPFRTACAGRRNAGSASSCRRTCCAACNRRCCARIACSRARAWPARGPCLRAARHARAPPYWTLPAHRGCAACSHAPIRRPLRPNTHRRSAVRRARGDNRCGTGRCRARSETRSAEYPPGRAASCRRRPRCSDCRVASGALVCGRQRRVGASAAGGAGGGRSRNECAPVRQQCRTPHAKHALAKHV